MIVFLKLFLAFILFSFLGFLFENIIVGKKACNVLFKKYTGTCPPLLLMYGLAGVMIVIIDSLNLNIFAKAIIITALAIVIECLFGKIALFFDKKQGWNYDYLNCACNGFVSIEASLIWFGLSLLILFINPIKL